MLDDLSDDKLSQWQVRSALYPRTTGIDDTRDSDRWRGTDQDRKIALQARAKNASGTRLVRSGFRGSVGPLIEVSGGWD